MERNVGDVDRVFRLLGGAAIMTLLFVLEGGMRWIGLIGLVLIITALARVCPVYYLLGINTCHPRIARPQ